LGDWEFVYKALIQIVFLEEKGLRMSSARYLAERLEADLYGIRRNSTR
jgi:hypothetical protein